MLYEEPEYEEPSIDVEDIPAPTPTPTPAPIAKKGRGKAIQYKKVERNTRS